MPKVGARDRVFPARIVLGSQSLDLVSVYRVRIRCHLHRRLQMLSSKKLLQLLTPLKQPVMGSAVAPEMGSRSTMAMSGLGQKPKWRGPSGTSGLPPRSRHRPGATACPKSAKSGNQRASLNRAIGGNDEKCLDAVRLSALAVLTLVITRSNCDSLPTFPASARAK
jgi:hypothetical protein